MMRYGFIILFLFFILFSHKILLFLVKINNLFGLKLLSFESECFMLKEWTLSVGNKKICITIFGGLLPIFPIHLSGKNISQWTLHDGIWKVFFIFKPK